MATKSVLKSGCCWRVGDGLSFRVAEDKWIPNHPTNRILNPTEVEDEEWWVANLVNQDLNWWNREFIMSRFHNEDVEAICRIRLSRRHVSDSIIWLHSKEGVYSCKSEYQVAKQLTREAS